MSGMSVDGLGRDKPFSFHWRAFDESWLINLHLPPPRSRDHEKTRASILLEARVVGAYEPTRWISYSRNRNWWAQARRYRSTSYTYATVTSTVDDLTRLGWLEHDKKPPGNLGWQSRFRATRRLLEQAQIPRAEFVPHEIIRLRDNEGNLIDYPETDRTLAMRARLKVINDVLASVDIDLPGHGPIVRAGDDVLYRAITTLHRVFNRGSFSFGGRFYGGWWQQTPEDLRVNLHIDGRRTLEYDYPQLHPRLLYAELGAEPDGDVYDIDGWPRELVKRALLVLVNSTNHTEAVRAIAQHVGGEGAHGQAAALIDAIKDRHPRIAHRFHSDAGIKLMRVDAEMAEEVLRRLVHCGIAVLPIHDSFIVQACHAGELHEAMAAAWRHNVATEMPMLPVTSPESILQMGEPTTSLAYLPLRSPDLFGRRPVPSAMLDWNSGIAPVCVLSYLRDEFRASGMELIDLASAIGVSVSQVSDVLAGRSGLNAAATARVKEIVLTGLVPIAGTTDAMAA
jgi:hypothetical protein